MNAKVTKTTKHINISVIAEVRLCFSIPVHKKNVYNTKYSQAVTHPSTNQTQPGLTALIGREAVLSG